MTTKPVGYGAQFLRRPVTDAVAIDDCLLTRDKLLAQADSIKEAIQNGERFGSIQGILIATEPVALAMVDQLRALANDPAVLIAARWRRIADHEEEAKCGNEYLLGFFKPPAHFWVSAARFHRTEGVWLAGGHRWSEGAPTHFQDIQPFLVAPPDVAVREPTKPPPGEKPSPPPPPAKDPAS